MAKNISKQVTEILKEGTPKQKAVLICRDFTDRNTQELKPLLTKEEAEALRDSLTTNEEKKEFNKWIAIYNTYTRIASSFGLMYAEYKATANAMLVYVRQWEDYSRQESHLNYILDELKEKNNEEGVKSFYEMLEYMSLPFAEIGLDEDGYVEVDIGTPEKAEGTLYGRILYARTQVIEYLSTLKAMVLAIDEWTDKMRSKAIMPPVMIDAIKVAKSDYALNIAPAYSEHELNKRIERGETISPFERMRAIYPDYDKVEAPESIYETTKKKLSRIYESERE